MSGYRYFYPDHILFNDLNMELNEEETTNANGETPRYDWYVTSTFVSTIDNASVRSFYGATPNIIGADHDQSPSSFPIDAAWIAANCVTQN